MKNNKINFGLTLVLGLFLLQACTNKTKEDNTMDNKNDSSAEQTFQKNEAMMKTMTDMMGKMKGMQMTGDFDLDFLNMMIAHHQGAIDMSHVELTSGRDATMKKMAENIIAAQKAEIAAMQAEVAKHEAGEKKETTKAHDHSGDHSHGEHNELMDAMTTMETSMASMKMSGNTDKDFAMMMIMHHQSAIDMAKNELSHGSHLEVKEMAQKMIVDQNKEIGEFQNWLNNQK